MCTNAHTHFLAHQHPPQPHEKQQTQARSEEPAQRHRGPLHAEPDAHGHAYPSEQGLGGGDRSGPLERPLQWPASAQLRPTTVPGTAAGAELSGPGRGTSGHPRGVTSRRKGSARNGGRGSRATRAGSAGGKRLSHHHTATGRREASEAQALGLAPPGGGRTGSHHPR